MHFKFLTVIKPNFIIWIWLLTINLAQCSSITENKYENKVVRYQPEQVHLSFGERPLEIVVTWSTRDETIESIVEYGINEFTLRANGTSKKFIDGGSQKNFQFIHRVKLENLHPNSVYVYHCGSAFGWSPKYEFKTVPNGDWSPNIVLYGDLGNENAQSLSRLQKETQSGKIDAIIHVGDFAYDMHSDNAQVGDEFMRQIETVAAYVPYMVCPGNHEEKYNFSNYRTRFSMPGGTENLFYSFNLGPIHFVAVSTEVYYFLNYGLKTLVSQYEWIEQDLEIANRPENRLRQPWIIVLGHRPMYCSNGNDDDCTHSEALTRVGWPFLHLFGLEYLFYKYGVDVEIWAHEHSYERLWPIYDYKVYNGSYKQPYVNPKAPVHLVTGSAGCKEGREPFIPNIPAWSAFHSQGYDFLAPLKIALRYEKRENKKSKKEFLDDLITDGTSLNRFRSNFSNYNARFNMPGVLEDQNPWYSFNLGPIHFISFSTEAYYFLNYGLKLLTKQFEWLENDLKEANMPVNRNQRPWIITFGHRPMYCSDDKEYDCNDELETFIRKGPPGLHMFGLEDLFFKHKVDVEIFAHEHFYTRLWPIYDFKVYNGSYESPYTNAKAPIQIITGSAGCKEEREPFSKDLPDWNAFHSNDYGYTRLKAINHTHLYFEQVSDDKNGFIIDSFWVIKDKPSSFV